MKNEPENTPPASQAKTVASSELLDTEMPPVTGEETPSATPPAQTPASDAAGEVDSLNRPFDPTKFRHEKDSLGRWKNLFAGRKGKKGKTPGTETQPPPPASFIPDVDPSPLPDDSDDDAADDSTASDTPADDGALAPEDAAEVFANAVYTATGFATGEHEEAQPPPGAHRNLKRTIAAKVRASDVQIVGWVAVAFAVLAYLLTVFRKPKTAAQVRAWMKCEPAEKTVSPAAPPRQVEPIISQQDFL
ncbi:hypothetical protein OPIT5_16655 [Opitutaceae bacterium TAV5]|nr:hypothetical protein OPIT5_16655 [Opitutaceae bacterium TAV5]